VGVGQLFFAKGNSWKHLLLRCPMGALIQLAQVTPFMGVFFMAYCKAKKLR
jgi:hypothetical protein